MQDSVYFHYWSGESHLIMFMKRCAKFQVDSCRGYGEMRPKKRRGEEEKEDQGVFPRSSTQNAKCNCSLHKHNIYDLFSDSESRHLQLSGDIYMYNKKQLKSSAINAAIFGEEEKEDQGVFPRSGTQNAKCNCSIHKHNISILFSDSESRRLQLSGDIYMSIKIIKGINTNGAQRNVIKDRGSFNY